MSVAMTMPILIVDDYNTMIRITRNLLRRLGFSNIDEACDGRTALAKLRAKDYALVISDWSMASMSGMELLRQVRADARIQHTPFVMVANDNEEGAQAQTGAGASSFIVKPFSAEALKSTLVPVIGAF
jgi:two-component system, chemotaxis family, chemotaxis protein CheY